MRLEKLTAEVPLILFAGGLDCEGTVAFVLAGEMRLVVERIESA
jgi:hypothetical protein